MRTIRGYFFKEDSGQFPATKNTFLTKSLDIVQLCLLRSKHGWRQGFGPDQKHVLMKVKPKETLSQKSPHPEGLTL